MFEQKGFIILPVVNLFQWFSDESAKFKNAGPYLANMCSSDYDDHKPEEFFEDKRSLLSSHSGIMFLLN